MRLTLKSRRRTQDGRWNRCLSSTSQTKPFDGARDRVKVDQKDLDEHRNNQPSWCQFRTGGGFRTDDEQNRCPDAPPDTTTQHNSAQHELALCDRCHTAWASGAHGWVPAGHPWYTRADCDQEAVGGSTSRARARDTSHRHKL